MFKNYFRTAWRNLLRYKSLSAINIGGLVLGIASSILLLSYVAFESGYDSFNANKGDIYRVDLAYYENGKQVFQSAENYAGLAPVLEKEISGVKDAARLYNMGYKNNCVFTYENKHFKESGFLYADASFLRMFTYPFAKGDASTALEQPFTAVISESFAKKLYGAEDPIGKPIRLNDDDRNDELCKITGVFKDVPQNSHLQFQVLISYSTLYKRGRQRYDEAWDRKDYYTYVQLLPGTKPGIVESKLAGIIEKYRPNEKKEHTQSILTLQPLSRIHLTSGLADEPETTANPSAITFLIIIAFFILTIGWINYINMTTAGSVNRGKEIGVRKVLGSQRIDVIKQFFAESFAINCLSAALAIALVAIVHPFLERQFHLHFEFSMLLKSPIGWALAASIFIGSILSGLYPSFVLSSLKPVMVLKGKIKSQPGGLMLRKSLLVFQLALSIFLIIGTAIVYKQVHYMLNKDLGMNINQVVVLDRPGKWDTARREHSAYVEHFKESLINDPRIQSIGMSDELPGKEIRNPGFFQLKDSKDQTVYPIYSIDIDEGFLSLLEMKFLSGRNFSRQYKTDKNGLILTASAVRQFGFAAPEQAIGKPIECDGTTYSVLGVVEDFNQMSLERKAKPIVFAFDPDAREFEYYLIKVRSPDAIAQINTSWNEAFKDNPFSFRFLNDDFNRQYRSVIQFQLLFGVFAVIAIVISCIGLFSLLAFMVRQRTREIGIRKVLGAKELDIVYLLSKEFLLLVLLGNLIAWPMGWMLMSNWLKEFAYRIQPQFLLFLLSGMIAFVIAVLTIGVQALRAARANPVNSLRSE